MQCDFIIFPHLTILALVWGLQLDQLIWFIKWQHQTGLFRNTQFSYDISAEPEGDARHIESIVVTYNADANMDGFEGARVFVDDREVGQVEFQDGKRNYVFGGFEGNYSRVRIMGSDNEMEDIADVEIYASE